MKKLCITLVCLMFIAFVVILTHKASAKEFEKCYHCDNTGEFHCNQCNNTGEVVCDGCHGQGYSICPGEDGKGPCDNGYYTCPSCKGTGYSVSGDGKMDPTIPCGNCNGAGKKECWHCHGNPVITCDRCGGTGKCECLNINCINARSIGYKCPYCKGTGWLGNGENFPPEWNDGVHNIPVAGDYIVTNNATWEGYVYGSDNSSKSNNQSDNQSKDPVIPDNPVNPVNPVDPVNPEPPMVPNPDSKALFVIEDGRLDEASKQTMQNLKDSGEYDNVMNNVEKIVSTGEPGRSMPKLDSVMEYVATANKFSDLQDGRLYPIFFEGHQEIGFPVRVSVGIPDGNLKGGSDIYVYHYTEDDRIEALGKAEYGTYESGYVMNISFYTDSFSVFFTCKDELKLEELDVKEIISNPVVKAESETVETIGELTIGADDADNVKPDDVKSEDSKSEDLKDTSQNNLLPVIIVVIAVFIAGVFLLILRKKRI